MSNTSERQRGLRGTILRSQYTRALGGISDNFEDVYIVGPGVPALHPVPDDAANVVTVTETMPGYKALVPVAPVPAGRVGYMASGAYVADSGCAEEWRQVFGHYQPVGLHDRTEKHSLY